MIAAPPRSAHPHFPVEGRSHAGAVLSALTTGSIASFILLAFILGVFDRGFHADDPSGMILAGVGAALVMEYALIRFKILPLFHDYARFRVYQHKVELYPLTRSGLSVSDRARSIPMTDFKGISVQTGRRQAHPSEAAVYLVHPQRNRTLQLKIFATTADAEAYAQAFADATGLPITSWQSGYVAGSGIGGA